MTDDTTPKMADVTHTHPYDDGHAGTRLFSRGPRVEADGSGDRGRRRTPVLGEDGTAVPERRLPTPTMADVSHTPPYGGDANGVWERGPVDDE